MQGVLTPASFRRPPVSGQETLTVCSLHISYIYAKKKGIVKKLILALHAIMITQKLIWLQVVSMVLRGDAAAETIPVLLTKPLLIVPYLRHRTPHLCGDLDPFQTTGQTSVDFSYYRVLIDFGRCACMVHSIPRISLGMRPADQNLPS